MKELFNHTRSRILLLAVSAFVFVAVGWELYERSNNGMFVKNVVPIAINGEVQGIDLHDGLKVRLKDQQQYFILTDYKNGTRKLSDELTFKDSLKKDANSDVVYLKKKYTAEVTEWRLRKQIQF